VQIVADGSARAHLPFSPFLRYRRDDTVFVDIQSKIEFLFHLGVFVCSLLLKLQPRTLSGLVRLCSTSKRRVARENMNGKHTPLFNPVLARSPRARSHKV
jgi:hypothetical protein